jgi:SHAQKYF class myb-like DNA-binding protein
MNSAVFHFATQDHEISHSKATSYEQKSPTGAAVSSFAPLKSSTALSSTLNPQRSLQAGEMAGYLPHDNGVMTRNDFGHEQQDHQSASSLGISSPPQNGISSSFVDQLIPQPSTISSTFTQKPVTQQSASTLSRHQQNYNMHQYGDSMSADSPQISSVDTNSGATSSVTFQQIPPRSDSAMSGETVTPGDSPLALRTGRWTNEEHQKFLDGLRTHGRNWKAVALMVQTRSTVQIRTHAQKYFLKEARQLDHQLRSGVETVIMNSPANGDSNIVIADTGVQLPISALRASIKAEERSALLQARRASTSSTNSAGRLRHAQMYGVDHGPRSVGGLASRGGAGAGFEPTPFDLRFSREEDFGYDGRPQPQRMTPQQQTYPYQDDDVCLVAGCTCPKSVRQAEGQNQMEYMQQQRQKEQQQRNSAPNHVLHDTMARSAPLSTHGLTEHAQQYFRQAESFQKGTGAGTAATQSIPYGVGLHPIHSIKEGMDYLNDDVDESGAKTGGRTPEQMSLHFSGVSAAVAKSMQHNEQNINIFAGQPERQQQQHQVSQIYVYSLLC